MREVLFEMLDLMESGEGLNQRNNRAATAIRLATLEAGSALSEALTKLPLKQKTRFSPRRSNAAIICLSALCIRCIFNNKLDESKPLQTHSMKT
ncbi:MAG: hypothetical protein R3B47_20715 [Bacteroidia bacterium]